MSADLPELRPETRDLIANPETKEIEFKQSINGLDASDMVAFANANGGTILIGVKEITDASGGQRGEIVGQNGSFDDIRNKLNNMASNCMPPLDISVTREKEGNKFIYRVDIKQHSNGLCCTGGGRYVRREEGSKKGIDPTTITNIILEKESGEFINTLEKAGENFVEKLMKGQNTLKEQLDKVHSAAQAAIEAAKKAENAASMAAEAAEEAKEAANYAADAAQNAADAAEEAAYNIE